MIKTFIKIFSILFLSSCTQQDTLLMVITGEITNITKVTATCSGTVSSDGGLSISARGICWNTLQNPTILDSKTTNGNGLGTYNGNLIGLSPNTIYYIRAYATNSEGTIYGEQRSFTTLSDTDIEYGSFTDSRDGNLYKTVAIGSQVWMAENLAYLPSVVGPATGSDTEPHYYVYGYNGTSVAAAKANCQTYGVLYNWSAAMNGAASSDANPSGVQGICPDGWHLPSDAEWTELETYLANNGYNYDGSTGSDDVRAKIAKSMATNSGWNTDSSTGTIGNTDYPEYRNKSGFSALPGGHRDSSGAFYGVGNIGGWWSSTHLLYTNFACYRGLSYLFSLVDWYWFGRNAGFSVRCVQN
jgi:uncharacterized protein (TIGR02145 family)